MSVVLGLLAQLIDQDSALATQIGAKNDDGVGAKIVAVVVLMLVLLVGVLICCRPGVDKGEEQGAEMRQRV